MQLVARSLWPSTLNVPSIPSSRRIGPLTMHRMAEPPVLAVGPWTSKSGWSMPVTAVITTGRCMGRQPAMMALTATFSAVIARWRTGSIPMSWSGGMPTQSSAASTAAAVGGTMGRPSVQPRAWKYSWASAGSSSGIRREPSSLVSVAMGAW